MLNGSVTASQRHTRTNRCPVCDGADGDPRGRGQRCSGYTSSDGEYAHCSREDYAGSLSANAANLYAHRLRGACNCGTSHGPASGIFPAAKSREPEAVYPYRDESGTLLFEVVRLPGKQFRQRRPDGAGGYEWKVGDVRRVLYRLPELIGASPESVVYIAEGEKDVDALAARGLIATCNPMGAEKWHHVAEHAREVLRGRDVVVVADRDDVGRRHAEAVAESLKSVARSVQVLVPSAPHKDVSDVFSAGGNLTELVDFQAEPGATVPTAVNESGTADNTAVPLVALIPTVNTHELAEPLPPIPYVTNQLAIGPGAPTMFAGFGYSLKTMSTHAAAVATAIGKPWWGVFSSKKGPVVLVDFEQGRRLTQERLQRLAIGLQSDLSSLGKDDIRVAFSPMYLTDKRALDAYSRLFEGATVAVVDSLRAAAPGLEENSSEMRAPLDMLGRVSEQTGCTIIVIHHNRKPSKDQAGGTRYAIRGSGALFDACSSVFVLTGEKGEPVTVHHEKDRNRGAEVDDFALKAEDIAIGDNPRAGLAVRHLNAEQLRPHAVAQGNREQAAILEVVNRGEFIGSKDALRAVTGIGTTPFRKAMAELETGGRVQVTHKNRQTVIRLSSPTSVRPESPQPTDRTTLKGESESDISEGDE